MTVTLLLTAGEAGDLAVILGEEPTPQSRALWRVLDTAGPLMRLVAGKEAPAVIECTLAPAPVLEKIDARLIDLYGTTAQSPDESAAAWLKQRILEASAPVDVTRLNA